MTRAALRQRIDELSARLQETRDAITVVRLLGGRGWPSQIGRLHLREQDIVNELNGIIAALHQTFKRGPSTQLPGQEYLFSV